MRRAQILMLTSIIVGGLGASLTLYLYDHGIVGEDIAFLAVCLWLFSFYASVIHLANITSRR
jgi:hypothetical protein